jgi:hypothetical protein
MRTNLKVILAAMGAAALVASPVMAKTMRHRHVAPSAASTATSVPGYARASAVPYSPYGVANEGGPYTPSKPAPGFGKNNDFQDGPR